MQMENLINYEKKAYPLLKSYLKLRGISFTRDLPKILGISISGTNNKLNGRVDFKQNEIFKIMEVIKQPYELIYIFFCEDEREGNFNFERYNKARGRCVWII